MSSKKSKKNQKKSNQNKPTTQNKSSSSSNNNSSNNPSTTNNNNNKNNSSSQNDLDLENEYLLEKEKISSLLQNDPNYFPETSTLVHPEILLSEYMEKIEKNKKLKESNFINLKLNSSNVDKIIVLKIVTPIKKYVSFMFTAEDCLGNQRLIALYNLPFDIRFILSTLRIGNFVVIAHPFYKKFADGNIGIRVDDPKDCEFFHKKGFLLTFMPSKEDLNEEDVYDEDVYVGGRKVGTITKRKKKWNMKKIFMFLFCFSALIVGILLGFLRK